MLPLYNSHKTDFKQDHVASCKFKKISCPNKQYGCTKLLLQSQWEEHLERECRFIPVHCPWCSKKVHNKEVSKHTNHKAHSSSSYTVSSRSTRSYSASVCVKRTNTLAINTSLDLLSNQEIRQLSELSWISLAKLVVGCTIFSLRSGYTLTTHTKIMIIFVHSVSHQAGVQSSHHGLSKWVWRKNF